MKSQYHITEAIKLALRPGHRNKKLMEIHRIMQERQEKDFKSAHLKTIFSVDNLGEGEIL